MANIPELLSGHVTLEVACLDRLYLNGYIGKLATFGRAGYLHAEAIGQTHSIAGGAGAGDGEVPGGGVDQGGTGGDPDLPVRPQGTEG